MDIEEFSNKVFKALGIIFILAACVFAGWLSFHTYALQSRVDCMDS